ncbi:MAG: hypothetical protein AAF488_03250 [Planctomycetota bacterium]
MHSTLKAAWIGLALLLSAGTAGAQHPDIILPVPIPPWEEPPEVDESVCGDAPPGHHYELDSRCLDELEWTFRADSLPIREARQNAKQAARDLRDGDIQHADEQRDACIEQAAGDPDGIAACESWHAIEVATATAQFQAAIDAADAAFDAAMDALRDKFLEDVEDCCVLVADPQQPDPPSPVGNQAEHEIPDEHALPDPGVELSFDEDPPKNLAGADRRVSHGDPALARTPLAALASIAPPDATHPDRSQRVPTLPSPNGFEWIDRPLWPTTSAAPRSSR